MWDPTGHVPQWVSSNSSFTETEYTQDYNFEQDMNNDGLVNDWYYTEHYKAWYEFNSYSYSWGDTTHLNRISDERSYTDYFSKIFSENWDYTYHQDWAWDVSSVGSNERSTSTSVNFEEEFRIPMARNDNGNGSRCR